MREARRRTGRQRRASPPAGETANWRENKKQETTNELVFGKNPVLEVIENNNLQVNKIWLSENLQDKNIKDKIISFAKEKKIPYHFVPQGKINTLTGNQNHQGIVLNISPVKYLTIKELIKNNTKIIFVAHETEDPHNLGAMVRTFVASGSKGIILTGRSNTGINSTVIKTSAGAIFQAEFARAANCVNVLNELKENGFWIVGTDNSQGSKPIYEVDFPDQVAIVVGNEHEGLGQLVKKKCDFLVKIPISSNVESLNVSVAFGIVLFEILRQRQPIS